MNLKELFDKAENGVLTYDQFMAAAQAGKAKFVDLSEGGYVDKQKYTDDLSARDTRIASLDETIKARDGDLSTLREQLKTAGSDSEKLAQLGNDFAELQSKYEKETKEYQERLKAQAYKHAVNDFANQQKFTSQAAKRDFVNSMLAKNLTMENDIIIGASDFVELYTKDNADAFVVEEPQDETKPHFVDSTNPGHQDPHEKVTPFQFNFAGVRPHETK